MTLNIHLTKIACFLFVTLFISCAEKGKLPVFDEPIDSVSYHGRSFNRNSLEEIEKEDTIIQSNESVELFVTTNVFDTGFVHQLSLYYPVNRFFKDTSMIHKINGLFRFAPSEGPRIRTEKTCLPYYRDVFIFGGYKVI